MTMVPQYPLRWKNHEINCSLHDPVKLGDFPHITYWTYYEEDDEEQKGEQEEEHEEEEEKSIDDERAEEKHILKTGHGNTTASGRHQAQAETRFRAGGRIAAGQGAVTQLPNTRGSAFTEELGMVGARVEIEVIQIMICHIPYKMRLGEILDNFNQNGFGNEYLDVHVPQNKKHKCRNENLGCVFVTVRNNMDANKFYNFFHGLHFVGAKNPCVVDFAHSQDACPRSRNPTRYRPNAPNDNTKQSDMQTRANLLYTTPVARPHHLNLAISTCGNQEYSNHSEARITPR
mmetsp:Transcript_156114/g.271627  ORF Transcript_156114/g.271627 Transcript_156114/m.271627 type:complete len:288 (-) Transcript_156114:537-1400(-)